MPPNPAVHTPQVGGPANLLRPLVLLCCATYFIVPTIVHLVLHGRVKTLLSKDDFRDAWFARFWAWFGPRSRENAAAVVPLLRDGGEGVCLDVGPGTGMWVDLFARAGTRSMTKIYGVEPNAGMHASLRENATKAGLGGIYQVVGCGVQELGARAGIQPGSIDTIVTVQCLCSIPTPQLTIRQLYPLLKPGGTWLVYEHIKTKHEGEFVAYWQRFLNIIWPHFLNGCDMCRPTDEWLLTAGEWEEVKLRPGEGEGRYDTVPHVVGTLKKKKTTSTQLN